MNSKLQRILQALAILIALSMAASAHAQECFDDYTSLPHTIAPKEPVKLALQLPQNKLAESLRDRWNEIPLEYAFPLRIAHESNLGFWFDFGNPPVDKLTRQKRLSLPSVFDTRLKGSPEEIPVFESLGFYDSTSKKYGSPDPSVYMIQSTRLVLEQIRNGLLKPEDAVFAAFVFKNKQTGQIIYQNPCLSRWPDARIWDLVVDQKQIDHLVWMRLLGDTGLEPISLTGMFEIHDVLGHLTEFLAFPKIAAVTRLHQREALQLLARAKLKFTLNPAKKTAFLKEAWPRYIARNLITGESLATPKLNAPKELIEELLQSAGPDRIKPLAKMIASNRETLIEYHGGGLRDFNRVMNGEFIVFDYLHHLLNHGAMDDYYSVKENEASMLFLESLWGLATQIKAIYEIFELSDTPHEIATDYAAKDREALRRLIQEQPALREHLNLLLKDRIVRFQNGMRVGLENHVTADSIIRDSIAFVPDLGSGTSLFFDAFLSRKSIMRSAFLDRVFFAKWGIK